MKSPIVIQVQSFLPAALLGVVLFAVIVPHICVGQPNCVPPPAALVGWWQAEGDARDSAGGNNGVLQGSTGFATGEVGQAFSFDGVSNFITNAMPGLTNIRGTFTMEFWAWPKAARASTPEANGGLDGVSGQRYAIFPDHGVPGLGGAGVSVGTNGVSVFEHADDYLPSLLVYNAPIIGWTHIAVVYVNQQPTLYINGAHVRTGVTSTQSAHPSTCLGEIGIGYGYYAGLLDEVSIYSRALSASEIQSIYAAGSAGKCTTPVVSSNCASPPAGLVGWWQAEGDARDSAGTNNGVLEGSTGFATGEVGQAFNFDGTSSYITNSMPGLTNIRSTFTMEFWAWPKAARASTSETTSGLQGISGQRYAIFPDHGIPGFGGAGVSVGTNGVSVFEHADDYLPSLLVYNAPVIGWTHIALVYRSQQPSLYINGTLVRTGLTSTQTAHPSTCLGEIGKGYGYYAGLLDEVSIYDRALSVPEIQAIYNAGNLGKCTTSGPPVIFQQPVDQATIAGADVRLKVVAGGTPPLSYQWRQDGNDLLDATNASLSLTAVTTNQAGVYAVLVTNLYGKVLSSNATLTIQAASVGLFDDFDPGIDTTQWSGFGGTVLATNYGGSVSGSNSLWFGGNGSRYAVTVPLNTTSGGNVRFYLRIASGTSYPWEIADLPAEGIVLEYSINNGSTWVEMGRYATSTYFNWTQTSVSIPPGAQTASAQFRWRQLSNSGALFDQWALDDVMITTGQTAPVIVSQPLSQSVIVGRTAVFALVATGTAPLNYQWQFNGTNMAGATAASLVVTNVQDANAGIYSAIVSNMVSTTTSSNATLTVMPEPSCVTPAPDMVGWWQAEGDARDSAGTNNGVLRGGTGFVAGEVGRAFSFDGVSNFITNAMPGLTNIVGTFTMEFWAWPKAARATTSESTEGLAGTGNQRYAIFPDHGVPGFGGAGVSVGTNGVSVFEHADVYLPSLLVYNAPVVGWTHIAVVYQNNQPRLYINGALARTGLVSSQTIHPSTCLGEIGQGYGYYAGLLDEVSIYSRALSAPEIQAIYSAGSAGKCGLSPVILASPQSQAVVVGADVTFNVAAAGTPPLSYQWRVEGADIAGATATSLTLTNVQVIQSGNYSVKVTSPAGSVTSSNALLTVSLPPAGMEVVSISDAPGGGTASVPLVLVANGNENALGFSLNFDPAKLTYGSTALGSGASGATLILNSSQVSSGRLGVMLALPADAAFAAGTQEVVQVMFTTALLTNATSTTLSFGDVPIARQLADAPGDTLAATYASGTVLIRAVVFEGDTSPRPNGNEAVTITDWVLAGRFAARLDYPTNAAEFQRADCAPRSTLGDGAITVSDWVQIGRYAAGLDPLVAVGGPSSEVPTVVPALKGPSTGDPRKDPSPGRQVKVSDAMLIQGLAGTVSVLLEAQGNENALGFSLSFDPAALSYTSASLGSAASGATFYVNTSQANTGRLGLVLALGTGNSFAAGIREVVKVNFRAASAAPGAYSVSLLSQPVPREVSDTNAVALAAAYVDGTVTVNPLPSLSMVRSGQNIMLAWPLWATNFNLQTAEGGLPLPGSWTNLGATGSLSNDQRVVILPLGTTNKFYRLAK